MSDRIDMHHIDDVPGAARELLEQIGSSKVLAFHGDLGAGKTTLIKEICKFLGVKDQMSSPTFAIVNEYLADEPIYHFDLYRLEKEEELDGIGFDDYVDSGQLCLIEWPQIAADRLPGNAVHVYIHVNQSERYLEIR